MIRHPARLAVGAAALMLLGGVAVGITSASAAGSVTATYTKTADWGSGWQAEYKVTNGTSSAINGWTVVFTLPSGTSVGSLWDGRMTRSGNTYTVQNPSWASNLAAGASATFGFTGTGPGVPPTSCTVNGQPCAGGTTPTTGAPTTRPPTTAPPTTAPPTTRPPTTAPPTTAPPTTRPPTTAPPTTAPPT
ncbi:MAG TPA: cellulose binding domain-containing protein, partial [Pilimelia sp.]|nr:cellulose binding domain-containing protein [Pilimelia sp.]